MGRWIDGLDELGSMTRRDIANASRAAADPSKDVDIKTFCVGVLTQKILPGARVIATGRNTRNINQEILKNQALMYEIVEMDETDRGAMVEQMEQNPVERERIRTDLARLSTAANADFLQRPLLIKAIIQLIIERKVNMEKVQNSSELYLMNLLKNLIFHTDETNSLTELDPPEHQDYLLMCLKLCQQALQSGNSLDNLGSNLGPACGKPVSAWPI